MKTIGQTTEDAYSEILKVLRKHKKICVFDVDDLELKSKCHLFGIELKEKYGLDINTREIRSLDWIKLGDYMSIGHWGTKCNRTISWLDNGTQPEDELLLQISFPTGAYIFGGDYPTLLFQQFFNELKTYNPKYIDTTNKSLYFSMENMGKVFNDFKGLLDKYYELNKEDWKQRKIKKMEDDLAILKGNE